MRNITNNQPFLWGDLRLSTTHSPRSQHTPQGYSTLPTPQHHRTPLTNNQARLVQVVMRSTSPWAIVGLQQHIFRRRKGTIRNNQMAGRVGRGYLKAWLMWQKGETVRGWMKGKPAARCLPIISRVKWPSNIRQKERIMTITQHSARALRWIYSGRSSLSRPPN